MNADRSIIELGAANLVAKNVNNTVTSDKIKTTRTSSVVNLSNNGASEVGKNCNIYPRICKS